MTPEPGDRLPDPIGGGILPKAPVKGGVFTLK